MGAVAALASRDVGIRVWHRVDGDAEQVDLVDAAMLRFEDGLPYRRLVSYKGQRNFVGSWWFETTGAYVPYESWVERDQVMMMDRARAVIAVQSQPFCLELDLDGKPYRHTPGLLRADVRWPRSGRRRAARGPGEAGG